MGTSGTGAYERLLSLGLERYVAQQLDDLIAEGYYPPEGFTREVALFFKGVNPNHLSEVIVQYKSSDFNGVEDFGALLISVARSAIPKDNRPFHQVSHGRQMHQSFKSEPGDGGKRFQRGSDQLAEESRASASDRMQKILDRTQYKYEVTSGQRSYGPGPGQEDFKPPKGSQCYFGKIPMEYLVEDLVEKFEQCGEIFHIRLMMNSETGRNQTYGFVTFFDSQTARRCVEMWDGHECPMSGGRNRSIRMTVKVNDPNKRLFVGPILKHKNPDEIKDAFGAVVDGIENVEVQEPADPNTNAKNKGFCFIDFADHKTAAHAKKRLDSGQIPLKAWNNFTGYGCQWSAPEDDPDEEVLSKIKNVYITKLTDSVTESDLEERFSRHGIVERVKKAKNYAFIDFAERDDCMRAIDAEDGTQIRDATMKCALAKPVPADSKTRLQQIRERQQQVAAEVGSSGGGGGGGMRMNTGGRGGRRSDGGGGDRFGGGGFSGGKGGFGGGYGNDMYSGGGGGFDRFGGGATYPEYASYGGGRGDAGGYGRMPYGRDAYGPPDPYARMGGHAGGGGFGRGGYGGGGFDRFGGPPGYGGDFGGRPPFGGPPPPKRGRGGF